MEWTKTICRQENRKIDDVSNRFEFKDDPEFKKWSLKYKDDAKLLATDFGAAYKKLTELGFK